MLVPHAWIACGSRELSTPSPYPFRLELKLWNRKQPPWRLDVAPYAVLPKSRQCLRTSSRDRFARATPDFRSAFSLPPGRGHQCRCPLHTIESPVRARCEKGCTEAGTSGIDRPSRVLDARIRTEHPARGRTFARFEIFPRPPDERSVPENLAQSHRQQ